MKNAILLCGYSRTWNLIKDKIIDTLGNILDGQTDWYVALWNTTTTSKENVLNDLVRRNQNVISIKWVDLDESHLLNFHRKIIYREVLSHKAIIGLTYLRELASFDKRVYEYNHGFIYDRVFFIRPDVLYFTNDNTKNILNSYVTDDFNFSISGDYFPTITNSKSDFINTGDLIFIAGSIASDILGFFHLDLNESYGNKHYSHPGISDPHRRMPAYMLKHMVGFKHGIRSMSPRVVRPNTDLSNLVLNSWNNHVRRQTDFEDFREWNKISLRTIEADDYQRFIDLCLSLSIDLQDYELNRIL